MEESPNVFVVVHFILNGHNWPSDLPIRLAVELIRPYVCCARLVCRVEADHVGGYAIVGVDEDDVADADVLGHNFANEARVAVQSLVLLLI